MLEDLPVPTDKSLCLVATKALDLSPEDFRILQDALDNPNWPHSKLAEELKARGFHVGETVVRRHRLKTCACVR